MHAGVIRRSRGQWRSLSIPSKHASSQESKGTYHTYDYIAHMNPHRFS